MNQSKKYRKEKYRRFCEDRDDIPLFLQAWWMDAVCVGKEWDVLLYEKNNRIIAAYVYHFTIKFGLKFIIQPQLTQYNGIWIDYPETASYYKKRSLEKEIMTYFIEQLDAEKIVYFAQNFAPDVTNWLPFYWRGYTQTTRYTYRINDISNPDECFASFSHAKRKQINKSAANLLVDWEMSAGSFYRFAEKNLKRNKKNIYYSQEIFESLYEACRARNQCALIAVKDGEKRPHAALFVVWDKQSAYALLSSIDPDYNSSGASTQMFWEAIKYASKVTKKFDFEGSMIENVENSFRQFGTEQTPYFFISKSNSPLVNLILSRKKWK